MDQSAQQRATGWMARVGFLAGRNIPFLHTAQSDWGKPSHLSSGSPCLFAVRGGNV
jgi:hypothetical protein